MRRQAVDGSLRLRMTSGRLVVLMIGWKEIQEERQLPAQKKIKMAFLSAALWLKFHLVKIIVLIAMIA